MIKRRFSSLFNSSRKKKNSRESRITNSSRLSSDARSIFTTHMTSSEIVAIILSTRSPMHFLNFEMRTKINHPKALINVNSAYDDRNFTINKVHHDDCVSKIASTLQKSQEPVIDDTIEQVRTDNNLSTVAAARNVDFLPLRLKSESKINQQRDQFKLSDLVLNATNRLRQQSQIARCILKTFAIISKPLSPSSEILEQPNMTRRWQECAKNTTKPFALFAEIDIPLKWSFMKRSNPLSCSSFVPRRDFSSKSVQSSVKKVEKDLFNANLSITRLRITREIYPGRVFLAKSFSCDTSEKSSKNDGCKPECEVKSEDKKCEKTRSQRKETCDKRQKSETDSCKRYTCPELRKRRCIWEERKENAKCGSKEQADTKDYAQSKDPSCSQKQDIDKRCSQRQRSKSCTQRKDCEKSSRRDSSEKKNDCRAPKRDEKRCAKSEKERPKCTGNHKKRAESCRRSRSSRSDKNFGKRHYSQQSIFSVSRDHRSFSTLISDIVFGANVKKMTEVLYASCNKDEKKEVKQSLFCEERKRKCETTKKDETKKMCGKGPAKCLPRKSTIGQMQIYVRRCQSMQKDEDEKSCEPTQKSCNHAEYCANRKIDSFTIDKKLTEKPKKDKTFEDKKPVDKSIQEQIDREYKEIEECKKYKVRQEKKDETNKKASTDYKPTGLDRVISPCKGKDSSKKFTSMSNAREPIFSNAMDTMYKMLSIRSSVINNKIPIIPKDIKLLNVMFDRSFSTTKVSYQDDFVIERTTTGHSKTIQNYSANNSDFIHGDELPNYIEIENDDEEDDDYDWIVDRPTSGIN